MEAAVEQEARPWPFPVRVVASPRRRKTIAGRVVDGVLEVHIPARRTFEQEAEWVVQMARKFERRTAASGIDVQARARGLAATFDLPAPVSVRWVENQEFRWGSCSGNGSIRLSNRLSTFPLWVLDYVLLHELAHLVEMNHGPRFHALVDRYPKADRARGFLEGVSYATPPPAPPTA